MSADHNKQDPTEVDERRGWFDEVAAKAHDIATRDIFFVALVVAIVAWVPTYYVFDDLTHWYVAFVVPAEIVTLLLVALMENHSRRSEQAMHRKLDAFAEVLAAIAADSPNEAVQEHAERLLAAVGLEDRESTKGDQ